MEAFLLAFGMVVHHRTELRLYMRGYGDDPFIHVTEKAEAADFVGVAFNAASRAELQAYAARVGAPLEPTGDPGGGERVRVTDPYGFQIDLIHGAEPNEPLPEMPASFQGNFANEREGWSSDARYRREGSTKRVTRLAPDADTSNTTDPENNLSPPMSAHVIRLGHLVLNVRPPPLLLLVLVVAGLLLVLLHVPPLVLLLLLLLLPLLLLLVLPLVPLDLLSSPPCCCRPAC